MNKQLMAIIAVIDIVTLILLSGCRTTKYVPVETIITKTIERHDTVATHDTLTNNTTTIIRELDSLQMAEYGIRLASQQKAWLVDRQSLQQQISKLQQSYSESIHDTIVKPQPYEVTKEVPAELSWWQKFRMRLGDSVMCVLSFTLLYYIYRLYRKFRS